MANTKQLSRKKAQRGGFVLGQKAFEKISAVEGIRLTAEMRRDLKRLDDSRLGTEAERRSLIQKYGRSACGRMSPVPTASLAGTTACSRRSPALSALTCV
jgi:hypothetical protein